MSAGDKDAWVKRRRAPSVLDVRARPNLSHFAAVGRVPARASGSEDGLTKATLDFLVEGTVDLRVDVDPATMG